MIKVRFATVWIGVLAIATASAALAQSGAEATYKAKCQMCHSATGMGDTPAGKAMKVKPFSDPEVLKLSEAAMVNITKNGQGKMPAFKDKLTDAQIKDVVSYSISLAKKAK